MEIKQITQTILTASPGCILTNDESYGYTVALGANDDANNWYEITEEAYFEILSEQNPIAPIE